jgi:hypothetical protein
LNFEVLQQKIRRIAVVGLDAARHAAVAGHEDEVGGGDQASAITKTCKARTR